MMFFPIGFEFPNGVAVQRLHETDLRHHGITAAAAKHQDFDSRLPFG
jgi:hypothetical protein